MTEKLINNIYNILDDVYYWESCPQEYNDKIDVIKKELQYELKKMHVAVVGGSLPSDEEIREAADEWVFDKNGMKWSNNDDTAGDNYSSFIAGAKWAASRFIND